jgi:hypothetical protein
VIDAVLEAAQLGFGSSRRGPLVLGFERLTPFPSAAVQERSSASVSHRVLASVKPYAGGIQARGSSGSRAPDSDPAPHTIAPSASNTTIDPSGIHR